MPPSFDNIINKFKASTKQAADQMGKATKIAKLKMDIMTLAGERSRFYQTVGERTYELFSEAGSIDSNTLRERVRHEFTQIERINSRVRELEEQIADLQAMVQQGGEAEVAEAADVHEVKSEGEAAQSQSEGPAHDDQAQ